MALTQLKTGAIADDAVTTDKLANAINTERTANTAKSTNATHTGEVTGSGALTITADAVTGAKIADDAVGAEHIEQLDADLSFADSAKAKFGAGNDLEIHHTSNDNIINSATTNLYIQRNGTTSLTFDGNGDLNIPDSKVLGFGNSADYQLSFDGSTVIHSAANNNISIRAKTGENAILMQPDSSVSLYYDDVKKLSTTANGICFNSDTAAANALNDYEEGTFSPKIRTIGASTGEQIGNGVYTKIGNTVMINVQFDNKDCQSLQDSNYILITNLPFTANSVPCTSTVPHMYNVSWNGDRVQSFIPSANTSTLEGYESRSGGSWFSWASGDFRSSGVYLRFNMTYFTDS